MRAIPAASPKLSRARGLSSLFAQSSDTIKQGDYYAPTQTLVLHATPQELNEIKQGDYYAPSNTVVQEPTAQELNQARQGDFYAPGAGE